MATKTKFTDIFFLFIQAGFMLSITLIFFFSFFLLCYLTINYKLKIQYERENNIAQGRRAEAKKGVQ